MHTADLQKYNICPMMHKFGTPLPKNPFLLALKQALVYLYIFEMSSETRVRPNNKKKVERYKISYQSMMNKWDKIWTKEAKNTELSDKEIAKKAVDGWLIIKKYMDDVYLDDTRLPNIAGLNYRATFDGCHIDTTYDVILSDEDGFLTLIEFSMSTNDKYLQKQLDDDIAAKAKLLLLHEAMPDVKCQLVRYNLNKKLLSAFVYGTKEFFKDTRETICKILHNIDNKIYKPNPNCKCVHPEKCKNGKE
jgi:hypothetical protein